jgi:cyclohexadienyl dehydratase
LFLAKESLMSRYFTCLVAALLLAANSAYAQQPSRLDEIVRRGTLRVGMTGDYLPFTYLDKATEKFRGFDVDMAEALGKALGVKVDYVRTAWPQLTKDFEADKFDIAMGGVSKTPIARCADVAKYGTIADIDKSGVRVIENPGGTNERFARANLKNAGITIHNDNVTIFDEIAKGNADLMITDASETLYQQKLHQGVLCAVHPDRPFSFAEKAYWLQRDSAFKDFVDQWLHIAMEDGSFAKLHAAWLE